MMINVTKRCPLVSGAGAHSLRHSRSSLFKLRVTNGMSLLRLPGRYVTANAATSNARTCTSISRTRLCPPGKLQRFAPSYRLTAARAGKSDCQDGTQDSHPSSQGLDNESSWDVGHLSSVASRLHQAAAQGSHVMMHLALALCMTALALLPSVAFLSSPARASSSQRASTSSSQTVTLESSSRGSPSLPAVYTTGTPLEELIKEADRQLEARVGSAIDALSSGRASSDGAEEVCQRRGAPYAEVGDLCCSVPCGAVLSFSLPCCAEQPACQSSDGGLEGLSEEARQFNELAREVINEVWEVVDQNYLDARRRGFDHTRWAELRDEALNRTYRDRGGLERAVKNMLARGLSDPYTRYVPPRDFEAMAKYDVTGIGLNLGTAQEFVEKTGIPLPEDSKQDDRVWVVGVIYGSNSDKAGIQQGDAILAVDGQRLKGLSPFQVASLIQGNIVEANAGGAPSQATAAVALEVQKREGGVVTKTVDKPIRIIPTPVSDIHIEKKKKRGDVGYVRLSTFNARAQKDLSAAILRLDGQGVDEFVLDLRDNYGGLVSEGIEVARLFLEDNAPIVYTRGQRDRSDAPVAPGPALTTKPLTVLVNEHSASASEILAGALKDNCRAVLVGKKTYGKGLIQSVYALSDGSGLVTTVGKYLTPSLTDIDLYGIQPDFESLPAKEKAEDALQACRLRQEK